MPTLKLEVPESVREQLDVWQNNGRMTGVLELLASLVTEAVDQLARVRARLESR